MIDLHKFFPTICVCKSFLLDCLLNGKRQNQKTLSPSKIFSNNEMNPETLTNSQMNGEINQCFQNTHLKKEISSSHKAFHFIFLVK